MTPKEKIDFRVQQLAIINAEYEEEKAMARARGHGHSVTHAIIAKRHGLNPKQLRYYRTNHLTPSRQDRRQYAH